MHPLSEKLDKMASELEEKGLTKEAEYLDTISNTIDSMLGDEYDPMDSLVGDFGKDASDGEVDASNEELTAMVQDEMNFLESALTEVEAANAVGVEAAKKKKKWIGGIDLKKGRFTEYCKKNGFDGPCQECANKALKSDEKSVRGMASFYLATKGMRKKKKKGKKKD